MEWIVVRRLMPMPQTRTDYYRYIDIDIYIYARYGLHGGQLEAIIYCRLKCTHTALHSHKSRQGV